MGSDKKDKLNVFIDSCILLNIYDLSGSDLDEFKKIAELARSNEIVIYAPEQVTDEFWRNREGGVAAALKRFKETKVTAFIPNLMRSYKKTTELQDAIGRVDAAVKEITALVETDVNNDSLKADKVVIDLLNVAKTNSADKDLVKRAELRAARGNPPGKKGSLGDAINWETLLKSVPDNENLTVVSSDGDFEAPLPGSKRIKEFLVREWKSKKGAEVTLYKSLTDFLKVHFPGIKLSDEIAKATAIERLGLSASFNETHSIIAQLSKYADFKDDEIERILSAYFYNTQVRQIFRDEDILGFARKIAKLTDKSNLELVKKLKSKLEEVSSE